MLVGVGYSYTLNKTFGHNIALWEDLDKPTASRHLQALTCALKKQMTPILPGASPAVVSCCTSCSTAWASALLQALLLPLLYCWQPRTSRKQTGGKSGSKAGLCWAVQPSISWLL